ncbi:MAG: alpha/beta hydrolase [Chitinophagaceae bacterium]|nr:alpha/beta hydrolase [Chitinophagaceae bacterium]
MKVYIWICFGAFLIASCVKQDTVSPGSGTNTAQTTSDVSYGTDAKQKIDIYLPAGRGVENTKTVVLIHGGGWVEGDKSDMTFGVDSLKTRLPGYAIININYRLAFNATTNLFPAQENDVKAAIDFYLGKSAEYKVSKDLIVLGASAGAHLALLHSFKNDPEKHVKAVIDFFGPADLTTLWNGGPVQQLILVSVTGKSYDQDPAIYEQSSPVNFITAQTPPTIVLQGGTDNLVPPEQATILISKLQEKGVVNQLVFYPSEGHGWTGSNLIDSFEKIQAFVLANVH